MNNDRGESGGRRELLQWSSRDQSTKACYLTYVVFLMRFECEFSLCLSLSLYLDIEIKEL